MKHRRKELNHPEDKGWKCTRCEAWIKPQTMVWLDLSTTDGKYYEQLPEGHGSQGCFPFGSDCAKKEVSHGK